MNYEIFTNPRWTDMDSMQPLDTPVIGQRLQQPSTKKTQKCIDATMFVIGCSFAIDQWPIGVEPILGRREFKGRFY